MKEITNFLGINLNSNTIPVRKQNPNSAQFSLSAPWSKFSHCNCFSGGRADFAELLSYRQSLLWKERPKNPIRWSHFRCFGPGLISMRHGVARRIVSMQGTRKTLKEAAHLLTASSSSNERGKRSCQTSMGSNKGSDTCYGYVIWRSVHFKYILLYSKVFQWLFWMLVGHHVTKFILQVNKVNGIPTITFDRNIYSECISCVSWTKALRGFRKEDCTCYRDLEEAPQIPLSKKHSG